MEPVASPTSKRCTILFVDVVRSSELYVDLGDEAARARVAACLADLQRAAEQHGGRLVKSLGDGLLCAFESEPLAVDAAFELLASAPRHRLRVRIGMHAGEVLVEDLDLYGQAVNAAAHLISLARPSEILVTSEVVAGLAPERRQEARQVHGLALKGWREPLDLFVLERADMSATLVATAAVVRPPEWTGQSLEISLGERTWRVGPLTGLTLGRDAGNDVVVLGEKVSRRHAAIGERSSKFVLVDQSVNGTWLVPADGSVLRLLREAAPLHGSGRIYLGLPPDHAKAEPIEFRTLAGSG
jgi:class 3 adenylate cyclase